MFKRIFLSLAVVLAGAFALAGEIDIPADKRVKNLPSGCCTWSAIENLGNVHGVGKLGGITKRRHDRSEEVVAVQTTEFIHPYGWVLVTRQAKRGDAPGTPARVREELDGLKVRYKLQSDTTKDTAILKEAIDGNLGCAVGLRGWPGPNDYHMVTLTDLTDKRCVFVENRGKCERYVGTREWFDAHWSGFTVVIYPEPETAPAPREKK